MTRAIATAATVVISVPQISGQPVKYQIEWPGRAVFSCIARSCRSTSPPGPNQPSPLCANDGQAFMKTVTIIAAMNANTPTASAPSRSSARLSVLPEAQRLMRLGLGVAAASGSLSIRS